MATETWVDHSSERKYFLDRPANLDPGEEVTFVLSLHGGGASGPWHHRYFPVKDYVDQYRLVVATPSAATVDPARRWIAEADDQHLRAIVDTVLDQFGPDAVRSVWLAGHSQGGMTSNRLLLDDYFADRVDGWLSLSGGRLGPLDRSPNAGRPARPGDPPRPRIEPLPMPTADLSFIFATGEHELASVPETSTWAERYGAGPRVRRDDVVDTEPGQIHDSSWGGDVSSTPAWGFEPRPGTAEVFVYPNAAGGRVIADVIRLDKGHTEGLEPRITEEIVRLMVAAPGGKARAVVHRSEAPA